MRPRGKRQKENRIKYNEETTQRNIKLKQEIIQQSVPQQEKQQQKFLPFDFLLLKAKSLDVLFSIQSVAMLFLLFFLKIAV